MKPIVFALLLLTSISATAQNIGINNPSPAFPLSFSHTLGNKIGFWGEDPSYHYGIGIQSSLMQLYTDAGYADIGFGHGSSYNFNERMRIINEGANGMQLNGRILLRNGTQDPANGAGIWLYRPDNLITMGFIGVQNASNMGFYGNTGWGLVYNTQNGRVGLGTQTPVNRLDVAGLDNWDLVNGEGDMRIGTSAYRLKMGVALTGGGTGAAGIMQGGGIGVLSIGANNKFLMHLNGSGNFVDFTNNTGGIRINGNAGGNGQVLTSNGNAAPGWKSGTNSLYNSTVGLRGTGGVTVSNPFVDIPGLIYTFSTPGNAKVLLNYTLTAFSPFCAFCGRSVVYIRPNLNGTDLPLSTYTIQNNEVLIMLPGSAFISVPGGTHTIKIRASVAGPSCNIGIADSYERNEMIVQVIPE